MLVNVQSAHPNTSSVEFEMGVWEANRINIWLKAATVIALAGSLAACVTTTLDVDNPSPGVAATWEGGVHVLPSAATRSGRREFVRFIYEDPKGWGGRVAREFLKPEVKIPAVVYLHSCAGIGGMTYQWAEALNKIGVAFFAPDSFARPGREKLCYAAGTTNWRIQMRNEEALNAALQLKQQTWIDPKRLILVGFSEGAWGAYDGDDFTAQILLASDCRYARGWVRKSMQGSRRPAAPDGVAVLNVVGSRDQDGYGKGCRIRSDNRGSKVVVLKGGGHRVYPARESVTAVAEFLKACCGL